MPDLRTERRLALGLRVKELRRQRGLSQERLADVAGMDRSHLAHIEAGDINPALDTLYVIADGLGVEITQLFVE